MELNENNSKEAAFTRIFSDLKEEVKTKSV